VLGLTGSDISTTKGETFDWGILGLATLSGETCVISSFRTHRGVTLPDQADIRLAKTAVHEIGHTFGLPHCPNIGCLMEDGQGTVFTSDREYVLCDQCRERLTRSGTPLTEPIGTPPWPEPRE
jgi:archaemetzincin